MTSIEYERLKGRALQAARTRRLREASEELLIIVKTYVAQNAWADGALVDNDQRTLDQARKLVRRIEEN